MTRALPPPPGRPDRETLLRLPRMPVQPCPTSVQRARAGGLLAVSAPVSGGGSEACGRAPRRRRSCVRGATPRPRWSSCRARTATAGAPRPAGARPATPAAPRLPPLGRPPPPSGRRHPAVSVRVLQPPHNGRRQPRRGDLPSSQERVGECGLDSRHRACGSGRITCVSVRKWMAASSMLMFVTRWECMPRCVTGGARAAADSSDEDDASWHGSWAHVPMPTWDVPGAGAGAGAGRCATRCAGAGGRARQSGEQRPVRGARGRTRRGGLWRRRAHGRRARGRRVGAVHRS